MSAKDSSATTASANLRMARRAKGLSLRSLAEQTGIPYSTLSKLENGKTGLTYDKLTRLAQGLGMDVADLVAPARTPVERPPIGRRSVARAGYSPSASSTRHAHWFPAAELLDKLMEPTLIEVTARSVDDIGGLVRHAGEEYLYVLTGTMELRSDLYAPLVLEAGDSVYFDSGMAHAYVWIGDTPCRVLSVCAGNGVQTLADIARQRMKSPSK